jgi:hypothetical protein
MQIRVVVVVVVVVAAATMLAAPSSGPRPVVLQVTVTGWRISSSSLSTLPCPLPAILSVFRCPRKAGKGGAPDIQTRECRERIEEHPDGRAAGQVVTAAAAVAGGA